MFSFILIFFASACVSFLGSLQLGPVNIFVINTTLFQSRKEAYLIALGGIVPEFIYCGLAVFATGFILQFEWVMSVFEIAFILVFVVIGVLFFIKKPVTASLQKSSTKESSTIKLMGKGFMLAILNPQLLPFWVFVQVYFNQISFLNAKTTLDKTSYVLGAGVGAFVLLSFFIYLAHRYREKALGYINNSYYFKVLSLLFFAVAIYQLWKFLN